MGYVFCSSLDKAGLQPSWGSAGGVRGGPLPDVWRGAHQHVVEQEEASLLGFDDLAALVVNRLHHVVGADQVTAAVAQELEGFRGSEVNTRCTKTSTA